MRFAAVAVLALVTLLVTSCHETRVRTTDLRAYHVDADCVLRVSMDGAVDPKGMPDPGEAVSLVNVYRGETVLWCNRTDHVVTFVVTDPKVFAGRRSLRLAPGECVPVRVGTGKSDWFVEWHCWRMTPEGETIDEGSGGSPGKSENPPPPPGGSPDSSDNPPPPPSP